ncbi:MAG: peroxiredoxin [Limisphaerales bacterium]|jgi:peroxiredoxin
MPRRIRIMSARVLVLTALTLSMGGVGALAEILPGHSYHGEAFDEGPRQAAYLMGNTGNVTFSVSTKNKQAQEFFNQGVGQLYGFWNFEAERSFRQVLSIDEKCTMAYWGMAMANLKNKKRGRGFIAKALENADDLSEREQQYIKALNLYLKDDKRSDKDRQSKFNDDHKAIMEAHPDDLEAKAFYGLMRWKNKSKVRIAKKEDVDKVFKEIHAQNPLHPAHHFRIHLWDENVKATNALNSAARLGKSAPAIAHMWHMPGHTYSRLQRYSDAAWQQEASARTDHSYMMRNHVLPDQIHNFAHNNEWLIRNLNHLGAGSRALSLAKNMVELPRHPKYNTVKKGSANYGYLRLLETLVRFERWADLEALADTHYLIPTGNDDHEVRRHHALGLAYYNMGDEKNGHKQLAALRELKTKSDKKKLEKFKADQAKKKKASSSKNPKSAKKGSSRTSRGGFLSTMNNVSVAITELQIVNQLATGQNQLADKLLLQAKAVDPVRLSNLHHRAGDSEKALSLAKSAISKKKGQVVPLASHARILWREGKEEAALEVFDKLRPLCAEADLSAPIFQELGPLAAAAGHDTDWRPTLKRAADFGKRPSHDSLGPFRWTPPASTGWRLADAQNKQVSLSGFQNQAVIVIFYLGSGCTHCIEQLSAFAPLAKDFEKLGIQLVGIGTEDRAGLIKSAKLAVDKGGFPFPLLGDAKMEIFKKYRAYDDFEKIPLHGTFLISPRGKILWQDISYEPFTETDFLLKESERLLGLEIPASLAAND